MKWINRYFWLVFVVLVILIFGSQNMNWLMGKNMPCPVYVFNENCITFEAFILNKLIRLILNLILLWIVQYHFFSIAITKILPLFGCIIFLAAIDVFFLQSQAFLSYRIHQLIHPISFSPLLAIVLASIAMVKPSIK